MGDRWRRALMQGEGVPPTLPYTFPRTRMAGYHFGGESYIDCGNPTSLQIGEVFSASCWVRLNALGVYQTLVSKGKGLASPCDCGWSIVISTNNRIYFDTYDNTPDKQHVISSPLEAGKWYYVVCVKDGATGYIYLNGVLNATGTLVATITNTGYDLWIGRDGRDDWTVKGFINSVSIYKNQALSPSDIRKLYEGRKLPIDFDSCVLWMPLYEHHTHDRSGYGNHGTNYGARYVEAIA